MSYKIKVSYTTCSTYDPVIDEYGFIRARKDFKPLVWNCKKEAIEAMNRIAEICKFGDEIDDFRGTKNQLEDRIRLLMPKWFKQFRKESQPRYINAVNVPINKEEVYADISFFRGYFEQIKSFEVFEDKEDLLYIDYNDWKN